MNTNAPPSSRPLTARQKQVLLAIYEHLLEHGVPPTYRELIELIGLPGSSPNALTCHLMALARKGYLVLPSPDRPVQTRGIRLRGVRMVPVIADDEDGARLRAALEDSKEDSQ